MSVAKIKQVFRRFGVRLALYQSLFLVFSFLILFVSLYWVMSATLKKNDRALILAKEKEFSLRYEKDGLEGVRQAVGHQGPEDDVWVFVRVESADSKTLYTHVPLDSEFFDIKRLEGTTLKQREFKAWSFIDKPGNEDVLEILSVKMQDGNILQIGRNTDDREKELDLIQNIFLGLSIPILIFGIIGGLFLSSRSLKPIRNLVDTLHSLNRGDTAARVLEPNTGDEIAELARVFNQMVDRIQALITGMRRTINDIAHDLKTPMTRFRGLAETALQSDSDVQYYREALIECIESSDRILTLVDTVMDIAEAKSGSIHLMRENVNLRSLIEEVTDLYSVVAEEAGIKIVDEADPSAEISVDPRHTVRALANLLDNAIKYNKDGGHIWISTFSQDNHMVVSIKDDGIGIPTEELLRIWTRLYRVDQSRSRKGLGLGLTLVKAIAEAHGGRVSVESTPNQGSTFQIWFPLTVRTT